MYKSIIALCITVVLFSNTCLVKAEEKTEQNVLNITSNEALLMEAQSGKVLFEKNADQQVSPASLTKIMTLLLIFENLHDGNIKIDDVVTTSAYAKSMGGSQVFLEEGEKQTVETLIKCIVIASGNDASVAMAEYIAGSESAFVALMNDKAKELGLANTNFIDCSGLTEDDNHYSCARDIATMSRELVVNYPEVLKYSSIWMETIVHNTNKGESEFVLSNTNKLLKSNEYVKGLKTGSTSKAKYCVSIVGIKDDLQMISVIMGAENFKLRFSEANELLNYGLANCKLYVDDINNNQGNVKVKGSTVNSIKYAMKEKFTFVSDKQEDINKITKHVKLNNIKIPVKKGDVVGKVIYKLNEKEIGKVDLVSKQHAEKTSLGHEIYCIFKALLLE